MLKEKSTTDEMYLLVVSIDNLDRCPHRQIVKELEAVHLFLEVDQVRPEGWCNTLIRDSFLSSMGCPAYTS